MLPLATIQLLFQDEISLIVNYFFAFVCLVKGRKILCLHDVMGVAIETVWILKFVSFIYLSVRMQLKSK